jgi:hypothetical protein
MLLYDRVVRWGVTHRYTPQDEAMLTRLAQAQVFELSNLVPLLPDWEQGRTAPVSKRPPYPILWGEWQYDDTGPAGHETEVERWDMGVLVWQVTLEEIQWLYRQTPDPLCAQVAPFMGVGRGPVREDFWACEEFYAARSFASLRKPAAWSKFFANRLCWQAGLTVWGMKDDATIVRTTALYPPALFAAPASGLTKEEHQALLAQVSPFRLAMMVSMPKKDPYWPFVAPWPVLMSCALLHCKNVTMDRVEPTAMWSPQQQRKALRTGHRPPVTHHVLRLRLPQEARTHAPTPQEERDVSSGVRFHLCRGHFKHLTHPRYKEPGLYWWPAHWRGDPALGVTLKDYVLEPAGPMPSRWEASHA